MQTQGLGQARIHWANGRGDIRAGRVVAHRLDEEQTGPVQPVSCPKPQQRRERYRFAALCVHSRGSSDQQGMPASGQTGACVALAIVRFRAHWVSAAIRAKPSRIMTG